MAGSASGHDKANPGFLKANGGGGGGGDRGDCPQCPAKKKIVLDRKLRNC